MIPNKMWGIYPEVFVQGVSVGIDKRPDCNCYSREIAEQIAALLTQDRKGNTNNEWRWVVQEAGAR